MVGEKLKNVLDLLTEYINNTYFTPVILMSFDIMQKLIVINCNNEYIYHL